jgi:exonuclease III
MTVLAAYAPNDPVENAQFLYNLEEETRNLNKPDICLGDWNMVEDLIDRLPHHSDHDAPTQAMRELKNRFKLRRLETHLSRHKRIHLPSDRNRLPI